MKQEKVKSRSKNININNLYFFKDFNYNSVVSVEQNLSLSENIKLMKSYALKKIKAGNKFISTNTAYDKIAGNYRFVLVYILSSLEKSNFIYIIKKSGDKGISMTSIYSSLNWTERELYDMFGIYFFSKGLSKDFRRILTDYKFRSYPLRKEHSLVGYLEGWWSNMRKNGIKLKILLQI